MKRLISIVLLCAVVLTAAAQAHEPSEADLPEIPGRWSTERIDDCHFHPHPPPFRPGNGLLTRNTLYSNLNRI